MKHFYGTTIGLDVLGQTKSSALLGRGDNASVELISKPSLAHAGPRDAGLFHNAIVYDTRAGVSQPVARLLTQSPQLYTGTGDHLVSEAFYFNDPEGNGIELYFDRPSDTWEWQDGHVVMDTLYIDPVAYVNQHYDQADTAHAKLGHVHLRVGDIPTAKSFYVDILQFDITADLGSALFISVAGYHHHIGLNTWMSAGAGPRTPALGLSSVSIHLQSDRDVSALAARLESAQYLFGHINGAVHVADPWGNNLVFSHLA
jgi:catechol 2,3-dioxygenase